MYKLKNLTFVRLLLLILQRYLSTKDAVNYLNQRTEDKISAPKAKRKVKSLKEGGDGGGGGGGGDEVYEMFTLDNRLFLDKQMIDRVFQIAQEPNDTDYAKATNRGKMHRDVVVEDIQRYMDRYYSFKKANFSKKLYPHAKEYMQVHIKTIYLILRGLLQRSGGDSAHFGRSSHDSTVNILWADSIGTFLSYVCIYKIVH